MDPVRSRKVAGHEIDNDDQAFLHSEARSKNGGWATSNRECGLIARGAKATHTRNNSLTGKPAARSTKLRETSKSRPQVEKTKDKAPGRRRRLRWRNNGKHLLDRNPILNKVLTDIGRAV